MALIMSLNVYQLRMNNMLYSLILVLSLSGTSNEVVLKENLSQDECVSIVQESSYKYKTDKSEIICRNDEYTLVI